LPPWARREAWIDYTFSVPAATNAWTTLVMNADENVSSGYDGLAAILVGIKPFAALPSDFQDLFFTNPSSDDWEQGLVVVHKGLITDYEWPDFNPFGVNEPQPVFTTAGGTTASKTETIDFTIQTTEPTRSAWSPMQPPTPQAARLSKPAPIRRSTIAKHPSRSPVSIRRSRSSADPRTRRSSACQLTRSQVTWRLQARSLKPQLG
jgi:hypothetical protein